MHINAQQSQLNQSESITGRETDDDLIHLPMACSLRGENDGGKVRASGSLDEIHTRLYTSISTNTTRPSTPDANDGTK